MTRIPIDALHLEKEELVRRCSPDGAVQPGLSLGIKTSWTNYAGLVEPLLLYAQADWTSGRLPTASEWMALRLDALRDLANNSELDPDILPEALANCLAHASVSRPGHRVLLHAAVLAAYTCFSEPLSILAASCMQDGEARLRAAFGDQAEVIPFTHDQTTLATGIAAGERGKKKGLVFMNHGLLAWGENREGCLNNLRDLQSRVEACLPPVSPAPEPQVGTFSSDPWESLPALRQSMSARVGRPVVLCLDQSPEAAALISDSRAQRFLSSQPALPTFAARCGLLIVERQETTPDGAPSGALSCPAWNGSPRQVAFQPGLGAVSAGTSPLEACQTAAVFRTQVAAVLTALRAGEPLIHGEAQLNLALRWFHGEAEPALPFSGEVGLVTGAASGIGKASAAALLERGAAVVGLDINPAITATFDHPAYLGLVCDITAEDAVRDCMRLLVRSFGGLDLLVLNAGLFPAGCNIRDLSLSEFTRVLNINLSSNLVLMREAYPLLKSAPRYGRVVIVGSKNTKAPGPGAAAYSSSKAGLTQMARVAALEWAPEGIRVNVIHPDAVFDTALYTEEVLQARAAYYGMTVEEYKKRNLLKTEITSHDIGEMVAEMCGPHFRAITGGQIQVDGGNERTI